MFKVKRTVLTNWSDVFQCSTTVPCYKMFMTSAPVAINEFLDLKFVLDVRLLKY